MQFSLLKILSKQKSCEISLPTFRTHSATFSSGNLRVRAAHWLAVFTDVAASYFACLCTKTCCSLEK